MRVFAADPGGTTGFAYYDTETEEFACCAVEGQMEAIEFARKQIAREVDVLVVERFTINAATLRKSREGSNMAIEIIGALRWIAHARGITFAMQSPSDALTFMTDKKLKRMDWYRPGKDHARDAARHLALYLFKNKLLDPALITSDEEGG